MSNSNNYIFRKINENDDINQLIDLIIKADPYTYTDLFGSRKKAHKILPYLIDDEYSIFYRDNYYCCELNGEIVGICSLFLHQTEWDNVTLLRAFALAKEDFPISFSQAYESFHKEFNEEFNVGATTCQVSVKEEFRHKGIASFLLKNILDIYCAPIQLYVNANNEIALKLYQKFGFKIISEYYDYSGFNQPKIKVYKMYRD